MVPEPEIQLNAFNVISVEPTTPRVHGLDLDFVWENANEDFKGVTYQVCIEDAEFDNQCKELGRVTDSDSLTVTQDRIYPHTTSNFFVLATIDKAKASSGLFNYSYELFKSQSVEKNNSSASLNMYFESAPAVGDGSA